MVADKSVNTIAGFTNRESIKLIVNFEKWLMCDNPAPVSVEGIRDHWKRKRTELAEKIIEKYNSEMEKIIHGL